MKEENNKMNISRRGFLKTAALAGAALTMPTGLNKVFAAKRNRRQHLITIAMSPTLRDIVYWVRARQLSKCRHSVLA